METSQSTVAATDNCLCGRPRRCQLPLSTVPVNRRCRLPTNSVFAETWGKTPTQQVRCAWAVHDTLCELFVSLASWWFDPSYNNRPS